MPALIENLAATLKSAREAKGLSQRALSERVKLPQSQISKIENAAVDLRLSTLMEMTRALDLELTLVPRPLVPAVRALIARIEPRAAPLPAYRLDNETADG